MPHFLKRDQIFAHQVYLLEHKLRSKEERILELETENALLHLRLAECLRKLRRDQEEDVILAKRHRQHQGNVKNGTLLPLASLLSHVQALKKDLGNVFAAYVGLATELEKQSKQLSDWMGIIRRTAQSDQAGDTQRLQTQVASLEHSLHEEKERHRVERMRRREIHNTLIELRGNIRVHCRVRPLLPFDHIQGSLSTNGPLSSEVVVQAVSDDSVLVNCAKPGSLHVNKIFEFERVHGPEDSQDDVYEEVKPLLTSLLDGYNVCIMAYGQTGSGKTYSMIGSQDEDYKHPEQEGIIPKAAKELFRLISGKPAERHTVEVSIVEVYNNELMDLLARDEDGAAVGVRREVITTSAGTSEVPCLTYELVHSSADVMQLLSSVLRLRAHSPTLVHRDSSRSHLIVTLTVTSKNPNPQALAHRLQSVRQNVQRGSQKQWWSPRCPRAASSRSSSSASSPQSSPCHSPCPPSWQEPLKTKLQLVDLAGSECAGTSGVSGAALWESSCINRSLSALSDVLGALAEQRPHVPYRNSKLTHLLQDSIGGDAKLLVMLCVSPTQHFLSETLQSLGFGYRARQIQRDTPHRRNAGLKRK